MHLSPLGQINTHTRQEKMADEEPGFPDTALSNGTITSQTGCENLSLTAGGQDPLITLWLHPA